MTPLEALLRARIEREGPIPVAAFMEAVNNHPEHGYYPRRDPLGRAGDFITAPEVSQVFGELVGVWCAAGYQMIGAPEKFALVELGPGVPQLEPGSGQLKLLLTPKVLLEGKK